MPESYTRLTILGAKSTVRRFVNDERWPKALGVRYLDWLELSPRRHVCEFWTNQTLTRTMARVSRSWPTLTLLCDFEIKQQRIKGLIVAKAGRTEDCAINY